jgi:hypothetical protein
LRGWAEAREAKQAGLNEAARADEEATGIPFGQPILVGHHSEGRHRRAIAQIDRAMGAACENARKVESMAGRADGIEAQLATSIYDDDPDAVERLRAKLEALEAKRETIKRYNASCRKAAKADGTGDLSLLTDELRKDILTTARVAAYQLGKGGAFPAYALTNLGATIRNTKQRIAQLEAGTARGQRDRTITARFGGTCADCGAAIEKGDTIRYSRAAGARCATECAGGKDGA